MEAPLFIRKAIIGLCLIAGSIVSHAQIQPYTEGSVWSVSFIKLKANMGDDYLRSLSTTWVRMNQEAKKQGVLVSYKILSGEAANPGDFDIILMQEYKNMASLDNIDAKWETISKTVIGGEDAMRTLSQNRVSMREIYGGKLMRELTFK
ncbi:hypothetical protein ACTHGU_12535 [Chitinophagaceae bacterium MMS25-I14]